MTGREQIADTMRRVYQARLNNDVDAIMEFFANDATFQLAGSDKASPAPMRVAGATQVRDTLGQLIKTFQFLKHDILTMVIDDPHVAVQWRATVRATPTGKSEVTDVLDLVEFRNGRIVSFKEFCDTALVAHLLRT